MNAIMWSASALCVINGVLWTLYAPEPAWAVVWFATAAALPRFAKGK